ncbi:hypothetical protein B0T20DRAFT_230091 [Sordaria brevicollis]|uniref:Myb-like domain-containing protein n=1 Tax=Sordaria brevicollis TaxID=83679 RepID=A0AAE0UBT2_SORBR|nr:hypothetical protein B0T20DRAFT_230091 [Sordaria brevicollis]
MLLPSAFGGDLSQLPQTRPQQALFVSPPASPKQMPTSNDFSNLFSTCSALQSLMTSSDPFLAHNTMGPAIATQPITPQTIAHGQLPTPPISHAVPPVKLRLRARKTSESYGSRNAGQPSQRKRIIKRPPPLKGLDRRHRGFDDRHGRGGSSEDDSDLYHENDVDQCGNQSQQVRQQMLQQQQPQQQRATTPLAPAQFLPPFGSRPQTPPRSRIAPEVIPLGLDRSDYHALHADIAKNERQQTTAPGTNVVVEADGEPWSCEEDRILVELVLDKLKLTKSDWQDCARSMGKDRKSVSTRWKSLMVNGDVGLKSKNSNRRSGIHGTWRC